MIKLIRPLTFEPIANVSDYINFAMRNLISILVDILKNIQKKFKIHHTENW